MLLGMKFWCYSAISNTLAPLSGDQLAEISPFHGNVKDYPSMMRDNGINEEIDGVCDVLIS